MDRVRSLRNIPTRLRGTNFCTSSACFAPSFVRQLNGSKCTQIIQNIPKHQFRVQWGGTGVFLAKNSYATSCHELLHLFSPFCTEFRKGTKLSQMQQNCMKHTKTSVWGLMGWTWYVRCEKFQPDLKARTFALIRPFLLRFS